MGHNHAIGELAHAINGLLRKPEALSSPIKIFQNSTSAVGDR
jgi:hypothetical protein